MMFSSTMGPDGQMRTEKFSSSAVGNHDRQMREVQQAYSNSDTGIYKMSLERQLDGRGRKMVKEHHRHTGEERHTDMYKGMSEEQYPDFDRDWQQRSVAQLPQHATRGARTGAFHGAIEAGPVHGTHTRALPAAIEAGPARSRPTFAHANIAGPY